jgi:hypothetical protein
MAGDDWTEWGRPILMTLGISLMAYFQLTLFTLSASYFMNKYIYRHLSIRLAMGLLGGMVSLLAFWVILIGHWIYGTRIRYFGLFPLISVDGSTPPKWYDLSYYFQRDLADGGEGYITELIRRTYGRRDPGEEVVNERRHLAAIYAGEADSQEQNAARIEFARNQ